jgi:hypothetical protein
MYKRFQKHLKRVSGESGSSESDSEDDRSSEELPDGENVSEEVEESSEEEAPAELVMQHELDNVNNEPDQTAPDMSYQCSLCPHKFLEKLSDVKAHLVSKVCDP